MFICFYVYYSLTGLLLKSLLFVPAVFNQKQFYVRFVLHKLRNSSCNILQPLLNNEEMLFILKDVSIL